MKRLTLMLALAAGAIFALPAAAQETGTRLGPGGKPAVIDGYGLSPADRTRQALLDFSTCVIKRDRSRVMEVLGRFPSGEAEQMLGKLVNNACLAGGEMSFDSALFRGGLYTALYREKFGAGLPALGEVNFREGAPDVLDPYSAQMIGLREFGECVVRRDPATAHAIVTGRIGAEGESKLFAALAPHLGPCLNEGLQVKFSKTILSGLFAEVLFRTATAGSATPPAGKD